VYAKKPLASAPFCMQKISVEKTAAHIVCSCLFSGHVLKMS